MAEERERASIPRIFDSVTKLLWALVALIVLAGLGWVMIFRSAPSDQGTDAVPRSVPVVETPVVPWDEVDEALATALETARLDAEQLAYERLDRWSAELVQRIDDDFLDWYFGYWNQQVLGLQGVYQSVLHWVDGDKPTAGERLTERFQEEFTRRVLRPQIAQMQLERITIEVVDHYVARLREELASIPDRYSVPQADWERYLDDIALVTQATGATREVPLTLKGLVGATAAGSVALGAALKPALAKLGAQVSGKVAGKAASQAVGQMAAKTGGKVAAKTGGKLLGWIVGVGIIVWDVWDHQHSRETLLPALRENLVDYIGEMETSLVEDRESGILSVVHSLEASALRALQR